FTGTASGYENIAAIVTVSNSIIPALSVSLNSGFVAEGGTITGTVSRNTPTTQAMTVTLFTTDPDEATTPQTVVIAAGQSSATFSVSGVQDFQSDGSRLTRVVAAAPFMRFGSQGVIVTDSAASFAASYVLHGDQNTVRNQGHLQIVNNTISNSLNY